MRDFRAAAWIVSIAVVLGACSHPAGSRPTPAPPARKAALPAATQSAAVATPSSLPSPSPAPTAISTAVVRVQTRKLTAKVPRVAPDAAPKILAVSVSETTIHHGDTVSGSVVTTSNVASVQARIGGYAMSLVKTGVGRFALTYTANIPWFVHGSFTMQVIAKNTRGDTVERAIPVSVL